MEFTHPPYLVLGPILGGFIVKGLGWRWNNWITFIFGCSAVLFSLLIPETYTPTLLRDKAARVRRTTREPFWWSRYDHSQSMKEVMKVNLSRPFVMAILEPIWLVDLNVLNIHLPFVFHRLSPEITL